MGQCGCGDYCPEVRLPGPKGITYTISLYRACDDCGTPSGVIITRHGKEGADTWRVKDLPEAAFNAFGDDGPDGDLMIPVLDPDHLKTRIVAHFDGFSDEEIEDMTGESIADEVCSECLREAFIETMGDATKRLRGKS